MAHLYKNEILFSRLFFPYIFRKEFRNTFYKYIHKNFSNISGGHSRLPLWEIDTYRTDKLHKWPFVDIDTNCADGGAFPSRIYQGVSPK